MRIIVLLIFLLPQMANAALQFEVSYEDATLGAGVIALQTSGAGSTKPPQLLCPPDDLYPSAPAGSCVEDSGQVVTDNVRTGTYAGRFYLAPSDDGFWFNTNITPPFTHAQTDFWPGDALHGLERWYGFSVMIDPAYLDTTEDSNGTIVFEWHSSGACGGVGRSPHMALQVRQPGDEIWNIRIHSDATSCGTTVAPNRVDIDLNAVVPGQWVDWVVHAVWDFDGDGQLEVWQNGVKVVERLAHANTYNDTDSNVYGFGAYKSWWSVVGPDSNDRSSVRYDNVKVGLSNSSFAEVSPPRRGKSSVAN